MKILSTKSYKALSVGLAISYMIISAILMIDERLYSSIILFSVRLMVQLYFVSDFTYRLIKADKKWLFLRQNSFDFIASASLLPSLSFFRIAMVLRLTGVSDRIRNTAFYKRINSLFDVPRKFLSTNGLVHIAYINLFAITVGSIAVYYFERGTTFPKFSDAIWWAVVTVTTVGYGDYVPKSPMGRVVAVFLMVFGIALISMLTGAIATYFTDKRKTVSLSSKRLESLIAGMDDDKLNQLCTLAEKLQGEDKKSSP